ncbi:response regulator [Bacillus rubiinfantis]|uniref:response regulator n=1 Tax=Bacillus rubiinfantis TaxID=1499680 RepID=UPI0005A75298|nr:response regulator [Bacillus rubiinfantis]
MNILLVDDEPLELLNLEKMLRDNGENEIIAVENGLAALEALRREKIDLAFLDIKMPGLSGLETLEIIRRDWPDLVVAMSSAYSDFHYAQKAMELGASHYLLKPFHTSEFIYTFTKLKNQWNEKQSLRTLFKQSILENLLFGAGHIAKEEIVRQFGFHPKVVVAMNYDDPSWRADFARYFEETAGYLSTEPFDGAEVYVTSEENLTITREKLLKFEIEEELSFTYGIGCSDDLMQSFRDAIRDMKNRDESSVTRGIQYIQENYYKDLTLKDVALAVHVSSSHLNRLFKKEIAKTFTEILLSVRINKAKELLKQKYKVEVVSDMVGFNSSAYFAVSFKKMTGLSPSQYRKEVG